MSLPIRVRRYGVDAPLPEQVALRAGPLALVYEAGDLRYLRLGDREIVRRIYVAVRDENWGTAPAALHNVQMDVQPDHFRIDYDVVNRMSAIDFTWHGTITGSAAGTIHFSMDGRARSTFLRNRLGFCVLHPVTCAGQPARIEHVDGTVEQSVFPVQIAPQMVVDGEIKPVAPFQEMRALSYEVEPGVWAELQFAGDIFEMEDQRNWTDASYKSYCTPLRLPFPVEVPAGSEVRQAITLQLHGVEPQAAGRVQGMAEATPVLVLGETLPQPLPYLGLELAGGTAPLTGLEAARLRALHLHHLRVDLMLDDPTCAATLVSAVAAARTLGVELEAALFLPDDAAGALNALAQQTAALQPPVWAWLVFRRAGRMTRPADMALARRILGKLAPQAYFGGGTDLFFTELNRTRPPVDELDLVCYSLNPQVHAFDNSSLVETLAAQAMTVASARTFCGDKRLAVTPVTLRMRFNPNATGPEPEPPPGELPPQVDARQMSLFGAAWTLGSLKYLATADTHSLTYYATTGWRGVMEAASGSPLPARFPSQPGGVFPLYHVLADVGEYAGGEFAVGGIAPAAASHPLQADGFVLNLGARRRILAANLSPMAQTVVLRGVPGQVRVTVLDEETMELATLEPERFRGRPGALLAAPDGMLRLELKPYAVARIDSA